ncbi:hypothetical protein [Leucobacter sp. 1207-22]|uniref:hypothetical protein n=1 Tax=Leucobacter sp. 1207-22 TaxID=2604456 RepID=UPI0040640A0B
MTSVCVLRGLVVFGEQAGVADCLVSAGAVWRGDDAFVFWVFAWCAACGFLGFDQLGCEGVRVVRESAWLADEAVAVVVARFCAVSAVWVLCFCIAE